MPLKEHTALELARHEWKRRNKGVLKEIAYRLDYSRTLVSRVFNQHQGSFNGKIEEALREVNAPGFERGKAPQRAE